VKDINKQNSPLRSKTGSNNGASNQSHRTQQGRQPKIKIVSQLKCAYVDFLKLVETLFVGAHPRGSQIYRVPMPFRHNIRIILNKEVRKIIDQHNFKNTPSPELAVRTKFKSKRFKAINIDARHPSQYQHYARQYERISSVLERALRRRIQITHQVMEREFLCVCQ